MKSDKIRKKNAATQIKKKKTKLKKNERINKKHDKYIHIEDLKQETKINCERKSTWKKCREWINMKSFMSLKTMSRKKRIEWWSTWKKS